LVNLTLPARAAFREAIAAGVKGAQLRFVEFLWFHCRKTATRQEQSEAHEMARELLQVDDDGHATYLLGLPYLWRFWNRG
jgi:hypothetical protein